MAEGPHPGQTLGKCEFIMISAFDTCARKMLSDHLASSPVFTLRCNLGNLFTNSSSHAHFERALKCTGFGGRLVFTWSEVGVARSRTSYDWAKLPWRPLQAGNVESLASKCPTSYMEKCRWCPLSDGRACSRLEDTRKALQLLYWPWYESSFHFVAFCTGRS